MLTWTGIISAFPILSLNIDEKIKGNPGFKPSWLGGLEIPVRYIIIVGFLSHRSRALDSWISRVQKDAVETFLSLPTVHERRTYIAAPVNVNGKSFPSFQVKEIEGLLQRSSGIVLISGEGGSGKTTHAIQLALWLSRPDSASTRYRKIPVLIEDDLISAPGNGSDALLKTARDRLYELIQRKRPLSLELVQKLLQKGRIVLIIDGLSERADHNLISAQLRSADFPAKFLVLTSRSESGFKDSASLLKIRPQRIDVTSLLPFISSYLGESEYAHYFDDSELIAARNRLSEMLRGRSTTALLAKLYVDQMIGAKTHAAEKSEPETIPDLMLSYLNSLNRNAKLGDPDDRSIHAGLKVIAWEAIKRSFSPEACKRDTVLIALNSSDNFMRRIKLSPEEFLTYVEERLRVIQTVGADKSKVKFDLDPLAEYLAALYLMDLSGSDEEEWAKHFSAISQTKNDIQRSDGFLAAVHECCVLYGEQIQIPESVLTETKKWGTSFSVPSSKFRSISGRVDPHVFDNSQGEELEAASAKLSSLIIELVSPSILPSSSFFEAQASPRGRTRHGRDFYNLFTVTKGLGILLGDVSREGLASSLALIEIQAIVASGSLPASIPSQQREPEELFEVANKYLLQRGISGLYVTMFYGVMTATGRLDYVNAGYNPPLIVRRGRTIEPLPSTSLALGASAEVVFALQTIRLLTDDLIVLTSGAVTEAESPQKEFFGENRLHEVILNHKHREIKNLVAEITAAVDLFRGDAGPRDDVTVLILKFTGGALSPVVETRTSRTWWQRLLTGLFAD